MGNFNAPVLTNEGAAFLASVIAAQGTVDFTEMRFSTTNYSGSESTLTAGTFGGVFKTVAPSASVVDGTTINVTASFDNSAFTNDYSLYSIGIIVDNNGTDVLLAVCTTSVPDPISKFVLTVSTYAYSVDLGVSTTENISVTASTAGMLTVGDIVDALTSSAANKPLSAKQGKALKALLQAHEDKIVYSANGVHGIKYQNGNLSVYDSVNEQWVVINIGTSFALGPCVSITVATGDEELTLQWTDPSDVVVGGTTVAAWAGTKVVRKVGSAPTNENDGTVVINETTRNQYSSSGYVDTGLTNGTTYYYGFFPYTTDNVYNYTATDSGTPVQSTVTVTLSIESAASDTVYITGPGLDGTDFITTDSSGSGSGTLDIVPGETYTFTSSVAKALDGSDNYYSKNVTLTNSLSQTVNVMPDGNVVYWFGYLNGTITTTETAGDGSIGDGFTKGSGSIETNKLIINDFHTIGGFASNRIYASSKINLATNPQIMHAFLKPISTANMNDWGYGIRLTNALFAINDGYEAAGEFANPTIGQATTISRQANSTSNKYVGFQNYGIKTELYALWLTPTA